MKFISEIAVSKLLALKNVRKYPQPKVISITPKLCHKVFSQNAFIRTAQEVSENRFLLTAKVNHEKESFFFDHHIDHIPGMLLSCMIRQSVLVVSHCFLGISFDQKFTMDRHESRFFRWAELNEPIRIECRVEDKKYRNKRFSQGTLVAELHQEDQTIAAGTIAAGSLRFRVFSKEVYKKIRLKAKKEA